MSRIVCFALGLLLAAGVARGEPYWISYNGNAFPEDEGWTRSTYGGGAERWIEDGALVLDGREDNSIGDSYSMHRSIDPEPGELFVMRLRVRVDELTSGPWDAAFGISSDESWSVGFQLSENRIFNIDNPDMSASFEPGLFHRFEVQSSDMRSFELRIDDNLALSGPFTHIISASKVSWGDQTIGGASLSRWDYFEFGAVPEPCAAISLPILTLVAFRIQRTNSLAGR